MLPSHFNWFLGLVTYLLVWLLSQIVRVSDQHNRIQFEKMQPTQSWLPFNFAAHAMIIPVPVWMAEMSRSTEETGTLSWMGWTESFVFTFQHLSFQHMQMHAMQVSKCKEGLASWTIIKLALIIALGPTSLFDLHDTSSGMFFEENF